MHFKNVSWDAAFITLLQSQKLGFVREQDSIIRVARLVDLVNEKRLAYEAQSLQKFFSREKEKEVAVFSHSILESSSLNKQLPLFLSPEGHSIINKETNTVIIHDYPAQINKINALLNKEDQHKK